MISFIWARLILSSSDNDEICKPAKLKRKRPMARRISSRKKVIEVHLECQFNTSLFTIQETLEPVVSLPLKEIPPFLFIFPIADKGHQETSFLPF